MLAEPWGGVGHPQTHPPPPRAPSSLGERGGQGRSCMPVCVCWVNTFRVNHTHIFIYVIEHYAIGHFFVCTVHTVYTPFFFNIAVCTLIHKGDLFFRTTEINSMGVIKHSQPELQTAHSRWRIIHTFTCIGAEYSSYEHRPVYIVIMSHTFNLQIYS